MQLWMRVKKLSLHIEEKLLTFYLVLPCLIFASKLERWMLLWDDREIGSHERWP
jgi:hypothetical protein